MKDKSKAERRFVLHTKNLPTRFPLYQTATIWLLLDRFDAPALIQWIVWIIMFLVWASSVEAIRKEVEVEVFKDEEKRDDEVQSRVHR